MTTAGEKTATSALVCAARSKAQMSGSRLAVAIPTRRLTYRPHQIFCPIRDGFKIKSNEWYWWDVVIERRTERVNVEFLGISLMYQSGSLPWPW